MEENSLEMVKMASEYVVCLHQCICTLLGVINISSHAHTHHVPRSRIEFWVITQVAWLSGEVCLRVGWCVVLCVCVCVLLCVCCCYFVYCDSTGVYVCECVCVCVCVCVCLPNYIAYYTYGKLDASVTHICSATCVGVCVCVFFP